MMTEPLMVGGLIVLITMMGLTALIVGTVAHAKGSARGYARGHRAGLERGRDEGRATGYTTGPAAAANPQVIRTPHVAHWERTRVSAPQPAATLLQPAKRGRRWPAGVEHTLEWPIGRHAKTSTVAPTVAPTVTSTEVMPAVKPKKVL